MATVYMNNIVCDDVSLHIINIQVDLHQRSGKVVKINDR